MVKNTKLKHEDLHNIFRQVAIAIKHTVLRDLSIGYLTLDNIIIEYNKVRSAHGFQEGVTIILYNFGLKVNNLDVNYLAPELIESSRLDMFNK